MKCNQEKIREMKKALLPLVEKEKQTFDLTGKIEIGKLKKKLVKTLKINKLLI